MRRTNSLCQLTESLWIHPRIKPAEILAFRDNINLILHSDPEDMPPTMHPRMRAIENFRDWACKTFNLPEGQKIATHFVAANTKKRCQIAIWVQSSKMSRLLDTIKVTNKEITSLVVADWQEQTANAIHRYWKRAKQNYLPPVEDPDHDDDNPSDDNEGWFPNIKTITDQSDASSNDQSTESSEYEEDDLPEVNTDMLPTSQYTDSTPDDSQVEPNPMESMDSDNNLTESEVNQSIASTDSTKKSVQDEEQEEPGRPKKIKER